MSATYRAIEISKPGVFTEVSRPLQDPGPNQVRIRVEACGVCHTDSLLVNGELPNLTYPRVPGHEVIGRIDAVGSNVANRSVGQRVGVGICGGWDDTCLSLPPRRLCQLRQRCAHRHHDRRRVRRSHDH
jgi:alcohol dehydrogenase, propanol-preferring